MSTNTIPPSSLVTFVIKVDGKTISDESRILSIEVDSAISTISTARIKLLDGDSVTGTFEASSAATFVPGGELTIEAGYDSKNKIIFKGLITRQSIDINSGTGSTLTVECRDPAEKMKIGRKSRAFSDQKDSDIISSIIGSYSGLSSQLTDTATRWSQMVQNYVSDWEFILSRAEANGMIVTVVNGKVSIIKPDADTTSVLSIEYGENLFELSADLDSLTQLREVKAAAWDYKAQKVVTGEAFNSVSGAGNLSTKKLSEVVGLSEFQLQTSAHLEQNDLNQWAKAQMLKSEYSRIRGEVKFQGSNLAEPGKYITLKGVGDRFRGDHLISGVSHVISEGNWITKVSFGLSSTWSTEENDAMASAASGLLPGTRGLLSGTVKKMYLDPDSQFRVLVDIPLLESNGEGVWARLTNFYSSSGAGAFFMPEVGDEVILGFLNEDPRCPVILGSLYSSAKIKPFTGLGPNENNSLKAIVSKSGIYIQWDDEDKTLTLMTPAENQVVLNDQNQQILLKDENGNCITMSSDGISIKSPGSIDIEAEQNVTIKGMQGISVESSDGDVETKGLNIQQSAQIQFSAKGAAATQVQAGAELDLQADLVLVNGKPFIKE